MLFNVYYLNFSKVYEIKMMLSKAKGYSVYENCRKPEQCLKGAIPLICTVQELYWIVKKCKLFISIRSGIIDYLIGNSGCYITLYPRIWNEYFKKAYSLDAWETDSRVFEYYYDEESEIIRKLSELVEKS